MKKTYIIFAAWFIAYIAALQFLRFKFGLFNISAAFLVVGVPLMWLAGRSQRPG
jgi:hypothetical protein